MAGMQIGNGRSYRDGILGAVMATGPGHAMRDGSLGQMATGPGHAIRDGSLGRAMAAGRGHAIRDGSLGCSSGGCGFGAGPSDIKIGDLFSLDLLIGGALGAAVTYLYLTSPGQKRTA